MYKHILIATDGSEFAGKAVRDGLDLARHLNSKVTVVTATEPWEAVVALGYPRAEYAKSSAEAAKRILSAVEELAKQSGVTCATVHARNQFPAEGIIATAKDQGCDLIVIASHGRRSLSRLFLGSEARRVLTHSTVPVLICR
jgi:nucleotide-binding universal stress UspA family protein